MNFAAQRTKMVDNQIRTTDVTSHSVLNAFLEVEREKFVPASKAALAYIDADIEVAAGRFVMEPSPLSKLLQLLGLKKSERVLEIGAASGYATALLSRLAHEVVAVESDETLFEAAKSNLAGIENVTLVKGTLSAGSAQNAPFDAIFINGAVDTIPEQLFAQLKEGGRLVAVVGENLSSAARLFVRENGAQSERFAFNTSVKPLPGFLKNPEFVF